MWHHHGSDTLTSARAILHHTDQKGLNILHPSVRLYHSLFLLLLQCLCAVICTAYAFPRPQEQAQADGYFQYVNVPAHKEAETGWNRGHPNHYISRYEQKKSQQFRTRVI